MKVISLRSSILSRIALPLLLVVASPVAVQAEQWGFSDAPRRSSQRTPAPTIAINTASEQPIAVDKTSGRYLQSVGKRVADRPLACPPKRARKR